MIAIFVATFISSLSEYGSEKAFNKMQEDASKIKCKVKRNGKIVEEKIDDIVVNDIVFLEPGDMIPADGYIIDDKIALVHILFKISSFEVHTLPVYIGQQRRTPRRIPCAVTARQAAKDACCVRGKELERYENWFYRADSGGHRGLRGHRPR